MMEIHINYLPILLLLYLKPHPHIQVCCMHIEITQWHTVLLGHEKGELRTHKK
jgi:hypothetical protein